MLAPQKMPPGMKFEPADCAKVAEGQALPPELKGNMAATAAEGAGNRFIVLAVETSEPIPTNDPGDACKQVKFSGPGSRGQVDVVEAPQIDGVHTVGTHRVVQTAIGNDVNPEKVLELRPDVVLTSNKDVAEELQSLGVPSVVLSLETGENIKKSVQVTGDVFGVPDRADAYVAYFDEMVNRVERIAVTIPEADKPSVLYIDTRPLRRPNLVMEWMLNRVGVESVTKDITIGQYQFSAEQLLAWNPELLIGMRPYDRDDLFGDSRFASVQAVKNRALTIVPTGIQIWGNNTAEQPLALAWVATQVFPGHYADIDMPAETKRFYSEFFRIDLTDRQVADLLAARL